MTETSETQFVRQMTELQSQVQLFTLYFVPFMNEWMNECLKSTLCVVIFQNKYKESGKKSRTSSLYSQLPQTNETQFNKTLSEIQSQVILHVFVQSELSFCLRLKVLIFCLCFRLNIKKPAGRTRRLLCTQNFLRLWTWHTSKKRHSCRVRYETTVTHIQVKPWGLGLSPSPIHREN